MLKIYTLFILSCLIMVHAQSQFAKGQKIIGGNIGLSLNKTENVYNNYYTSGHAYASVNPSFGTFHKTNQIAGIGLSYGYNYQKIDNNLYAISKKEWNHSIGLNFFSQRFFTLTENLFFTINAAAGANYSFGKIIDSTGTTQSEAKRKGYGIGFNLAPGLSYRLTRRLLFDAYLSNLISINYAHDQTKYKDPVPANLKSVQSSFSIASSLSNTSLGNVGLGFRWLMKKN